VILRGQLWGQLRSNSLQDPYHPWISCTTAVPVPHQIFGAADTLDAAGHHPALAAVRKALGGGSFTTISEAMNEWKARKAEKDTPLREAPPQAVVGARSRRR
jgi:hypothetical protein